MPSQRTITPEQRERMAEGRAIARAVAVATSDYRRAIATGIPKPELYARLLPLDIAELLMGAAQRGGVFTVHHSRVHELRSMGLVEFGGRCLTAFGIHVRNALRNEDA